jgi:hypothetical protein
MRDDAHGYGGTRRLRENSCEMRSDRALRPAVPW